MKNLMTDSKNPLLALADQLIELEVLEKLLELSRSHNFVRTCNVFTTNLK